MQSSDLTDKIQLGMPIWVVLMDWTVRSFKKDVQADLDSKGYYKVAKQTDGKRQSTSGIHTCSLM